MAGQANNRTQYYKKIILLATMVIIITLLHYMTRQNRAYEHIFYRELYFVPVIIASFWFGLRGGLVTSLLIILVYLPLVFMQWQGFSAEDFDKLMEVLLFIIVAAVLGFISDRERVEHIQLRKAESLAAMGEALSIVAHEMKTPLIAIGGFTNVVRGKLEKDSPEREKLDIVLRETLRLENMVKDMLDFSRPIELNRSYEDVNTIVAESISVVKEMAISKEVKLETNLSLELPLISLDHMRMEQVLINLIANAVQASPDGEAITVSSFQEGQRIILEVCDGGCGIPFENQEKIFTPFFSTKKEGSGLGLAIVKKIVTSHEGKLEVVSNEGNGTSFKVVLPLK